jgi:Zn-dependent protease with chaperone function
MLCARAGSSPLAWLVSFGAGLGALVTTTSIAWLGRTTWLVATNFRGLRGLPQVPLPEGLKDAARRTRVSQLRCVALDQPIALCGGAFRPAIVVSSGLIDVLSCWGLEAVLLHEEHHRRSMEPLRRAVLQAAAEVLFFVPLLRWLCQRRLERSELHADRTAIETLGPGPVAAALWALGSEATGGMAIGFDGAADARVRQLLGDPLPCSRPGRGLYATSLVGALTAISLAACLGLGLVG